MRGGENKGENGEENRVRIAHYALTRVKANNQQKRMSRARRRLDGQKTWRKGGKGGREKEEDLSFPLH